MRRQFLLSLVAVLFSSFGGVFSAALAQSTGGPLSLEEVLDSSAEHFPAILESLAQKQGAEAEALSALGAFDVVFGAEAKSYASGFYDGTVIDGSVSRNLRPFGAQVFGGYKLSDGDFPIYEDRNFTNTGGEVRFGVLFSLLRDRAIDDRRFAVAIADLGISEADFNVLLTQIGVQHKAQLAYWRWVAAGRQLDIFEDLLRIARARQTGLEEQVRQGARAEIFLTENRQNITRRQIRATEAQRDFRAAANSLSFYLRGDDGMPRTPTRAELPPAPSINMAASQVVDDQDLIETAMAAADDASAQALLLRPEIALVEVAIDRARNEMALGRNARLPRLDLTYELQHDFGEVAEGGISRDSTDNLLGLKFSVPFERRDAEGKIRKAEADLSAARLRRRQLRDQIDIEIRNILLDLDMARQLTLLAVQEVDQSRTMEQAERERFAGGASDFFLVNIREETAADAAIRFHLAHLNARIARANLDAATVNLERLGL
ncbi:MAG: TolC family protein [Pseudomonadota bacterium]